ncbi:MAG: transposase DNA-binding-containing protein [Colwellia sp.]
MLIKDTEEWANNTGNSIVKASGTQAAIEGAYRFIRNDKIDTNNIAIADFSSLLPALKLSNKMLALEDTSTLSYRHNVTKELGYTRANYLR